MDPQHIQIFLISAIVLFIFLIMFLLIKNILGYHKKKTEQENKDMTQVGFVVDTFHDLVSKLKEKEKELEALRSRAEDRASSVELYNENIIQSVPSGVVSFDQNQRITRINASALAILGVRAEDTVGKMSDEIFECPLREMISRKEIVERAETGYITNSGKRIWIGLALSPLKDSSNEIIGQLLVFTDLTELKAFQSQKELRDRLSTLGEMSAGIAHELRNPMAVISGYTKILLKKADESLKPAVLSIAKEIEVMNRIITDFLAFARPPEPVLAELDLDGLVRSCAEALNTASEKISLKIDLDARPAIMADEVLIRQAMTNLLQNAADAMPEGGNIAIAGSMNEQYYQLSVSDTGHGIPDSIRDKIFLPFYTTKERGTGLGLALVHKIIESHGSTVLVESSSSGTVFTIRFPKEMIVTVQ